MSKTIRQIRVEGQLAFVPLTKGYEATIDACDVSLVDKWNWLAQVGRGTVYAACCDWSAGKPRKIYMHRVLMGEPKGLHIDHIDRNGLNNRRNAKDGNLRVATASQNNCNASAHKDNVTGIKGVTWDRTRQKWQARICLSGKTVHLGRFRTLEAATNAYIAASAQVHGEFGRAS